MRLLLDAAPEAALERTGTGSTPLFLACTCGRSAAVWQLLAAAPQAARMPATFHDGEVSPLLGAIMGDHSDVVRLLLEADPHIAWLRGSNGYLPLHQCLAVRQRPASCSIARLLLSAAPRTAITLTGTRLGPLHIAAMAGNVPAVRLLLDAAPQTAHMRDMKLNMTPLEAGLDMAVRLVGQEAQEAPGDALSADGCLDAARVLLAVAPPNVSLPLLAQHGDLVLPLFSELAVHWPLTAAQWQQVPAPCPGLGGALPAVLARSEAEAALLVPRLPPADAARLRTFALALHRAQRRMHIFLPAELARHVLSLFDA